MTAIQAANRLYLGASEQGGFLLKRLDKCHLSFMADKSSEMEALASLIRVEARGICRLFTLSPPWLCLLATDGEHARLVSCSGVRAIRLRVCFLMIQAF